MRKKYFLKFSAHFARLLVYTDICLGPLTSDQKLKFFHNFSSSFLHIPHNSFPYQKHGESSGKCVDTSRT